jgi:flagellar operon protein
MNSLARIGSAAFSQQGVGQNRGAQKSVGPTFADVLKKKTGEVKFSAHAQSRVISRNIPVTPQMIDKLQTAVDTASAKGSNNSLVLFSNAAFIVNVPNRTVVTAMDGDNIRENIFTNIDSTVIAG